MNTSIFNEGAILKSFIVKIDDKQISPDNILNTEIKWGTDFEIKGEMIINDMQHLASALPFNARNKINISITDPFNKRYNRTFVISNIQEQWANSFKNYKITFIDEFSWKLKNIYVSKSYKDKKLSEIFEDYWTNFKLDDLLGEITKEISPTTLIKDFIVVPQNVSFYDFITNEFLKDGYLLYQTKYKIILKNQDELLPSVLPKAELDYEETVINPLYTTKIHEKHVESNFLKSNLEVPIRKGYIYDYNTKTNIIFNDNLKENYDSLKLNDYDLSDLQKQDGVKLDNFKSLGLKAKNIMLNTYKDNQKLMIFVTGNNNTKIFQKCGVKLKGDVYMKKEQNEGDIRLNGDYICYSFSEKIIGTKMIQKVELARIDFRDPKA